MTNLIEDRPQADHGKPFEMMAARVRKNSDEAFAGAFVLVAPDGEVIENLFINNQGDQAMFWSNLKTIAEIAVADIDRKAQSSNPWGR